MDYDAAEQGDEARVEMGWGMVGGLARGRLVIVWILACSRAYPRERKVPPHAMGQTGRTSSQLTGVGQAR